MFRRLYAAVAIDLPDLAGRGVECGEPAAAPAVGVDADEMADVENFAVFQRRVADDSRFS